MMSYRNVTVDGIVTTSVEWKMYLNLITVQDVAAEKK